MAILQDQTKTTADYEAMIAKLTAENAALKRAKPSQGLKVSEKGAVSIYGYGRFPLTVYAESLLKILDRADELRAFVETNRSALSWKD